jgi:PleD family two-component response regulator
VASHDGIMQAEDLIHQADEAMYRAKRLGRNCVRAGVLPEEQNALGTMSRR